MKHKIRWFVYASNGTDSARLPHTASMRGSWDGWDAECSCGWGSRTGGALKHCVIDAVADHKFDVEFEAAAVLANETMLTIEQAMAAVRHLA